jgi:hypothetical protein
VEESTVNNEESEDSEVSCCDYGKELSVIYEEDCDCISNLRFDFRRKVVANVEQKGFYFYCGNRCWETVPTEQSNEDEMFLKSLDKILIAHAKKKKAKNSSKEVFFFVLFFIQFPLLKSHFLTASYSTNFLEEKESSQKKKKMEENSGFRENRSRFRSPDFPPSQKLAIFWCAYC